MIHQRRSTSPSFQNLLNAMHEVEQHEPLARPSIAQPLSEGMRYTPTSCAPRPPMMNLFPSLNTPEADWRTAQDMHRLRIRTVVLVERMLRNHRPHDVLTQVPKNIDWRSKTFQLATKIERLMFTVATTRAKYLDEQTLFSRAQLLARHLVRIRKRKNSFSNL